MVKSFFTIFMIIVGPMACEAQLCGCPQWEMNHPGAEPAEEGTGLPGVIRALRGLCRHSVRSRTQLLCNVTSASSCQDYLCVRWNCKEQHSSNFGFSDRGELLPVKCKPQRDLFAFLCGLAKTEGWIYQINVIF